jgi:ABC-type branched-subunit amino acid transport system substrate-binding protein
VRSALRTRGTALGFALLLGGVAACSSAPLPASEQLAQGGAAAPPGTVIDPDTGQTVDAVTGEVVDAVTGEAIDPVTGQAPAGTAGGPAAPAADAAGAAPGQSGPTGGAAPGAPGGPAPAAPGAPKPQSAPARSTLFTPQQDTIGISDTKLVMCAHAALSFGKAFNATPDDFNVFWTATNKEKGGIHGRKVEVTYENDNYQATQAVTAATACNAKKPFMILGGIGFDQIPAVRNYAEQAQVLYLHHTATIKGTKGQRYSFTELPTVERTGEAFAQLAASKFKNKKFGIIERDSANWVPGADAFRAAAKKFGLNIVAQKKVAINQGNYTQEILEMKNKGAEVVFGWENALVSTQLITQAKAQNYSPNWLLFPLNLTSQTLGKDALSPPLDGVAMWPGYSRGDTSAGFAAYADDIKEFERQYATYKPDADLEGVAGDLLFLNWTAQKALAAQLLDCGRDCTRNRFVDVLKSYNKRPSTSSCTIDFTRGDGYRGAQELNFLQTYQRGDKVNWRTTRLCVGRP